MHRMKALEAQVAKRDADLVVLRAELAEARAQPSASSSGQTFAGVAAPGACALCGHKQTQARGTKGGWLNKVCFLKVAVDNKQFALVEKVLQKLPG